MSIIVHCCISADREVRKNFKSLEEAGFDSKVQIGDYSEKLNDGIHTKDVNIISQYLYMSVDRKCNDLDEQSDIYPMDVYFKGNLLISAIGNFDEDDKSIKIGDGDSCFTDYYFNSEMWKNLTIICGN
jgi:hypothetical protein